MRLVIATPLYPPEAGGPATYATLLEEGLPPRGIETTLVKFSEVRGYPKIIRHMAYKAKVKKALRNADAVLALDPASVGFPAMKAAEELGKPFFVKVVGDYAWEQGTQRFGVTDTLDAFVKRSDVPFPVKMLKTMQAAVAREAKRVIVPSEYLKGIVAAWGIPADKIQVIYNGIELPSDIPQPKKKGTFFVTSAGRRVPWKGFEALEGIVARHEGEGWELSIASDLPRKETLGMIRAADVFVLNSTYEGLSHVLIETMMLGTPIVATSAGGNTELITDGETGLLIPPDDDAALEKALKEVSQNPDAARTRAAAARERAKAFHVSVMLDATAHFMKENV